MKSTLFLSSQVDFHKINCAYQLTIHKAIKIAVINQLSVVPEDDRMRRIWGFDTATIVCIHVTVPVPPLA
jgi:hypothetical protein